MTSFAKIPFRVVPHKKHAIHNLKIFFSVLCFSILTFVAGLINEHGEIHIPSFNEITPFIPIGVTAFLIAICGISIATLKVFPGSPCYHLQLNSHSLVVRSLFKNRSYKWSDIGRFEISIFKHRIKQSQDTRKSYYVAAFKPVNPKVRRPRELLLIDAHLYGAKSASETASDMAVLLNHICELARHGRLDVHEPIEILESFCISSRKALIKPRANKSTSVIERT